MRQALLVVDYSNDFVAGDGALTAGEPARDIEGAVAGKIDDAMAEGTPVFFMMDIHYDNDTLHPENELFPPHNIAGTEGRDLYGRVKEKYDAHKDRDDVFFIDKTRYSAFTGTNLHQLLRERRIESVIITGVCTDICVLHTAVEAYNLGYDIIVPESCVATFNPDAHTVALDHFKNILGADVQP